LAQSSDILFLAGLRSCLLPKKWQLNNGMLYCLRGL
jgi:hypothetical protein